MKSWNFALRLAAGHLLVAVTALLGPWATATIAQAPAPPKNDAQVIRLKHSRASEVARILQELYRGTSGRGAFGEGAVGGGALGSAQGSRLAIAADDSTNSVVLSGSADDLAAMQRLIHSLDSVEVDGARQPARQELKVFQLRSTPDKALQDAIRLVYSSREGAGNFAIDARRNAVICSGDKNTLETVEALLVRLDDNSPRPKAAERRVRIVWLVESAGDEAAAKQPPDDLKEVVTELAKFGITKPRLAAQTIVNATENNSFRVEGSTVLGNIPCTLNISGQLLEEQGKPSVRIDVKATQDAGPRAARVPVCSLETQVSAPLGHAVVLGVTPTSGMTSVFVVQVLSAEPVKARRANQRA